MLLSLVIGPESEMKSDGLLATKIPHLSQNFEDRNMISHFKTLEERQKKAGNERLFVVHFWELVTCKAKTHGIFQSVSNIPTAPYC